MKLAVGSQAIAAAVHESFWLERGCPSLWGPYPSRAATQYGRSYGCRGATGANDGDAPANALLVPFSERTITCVHAHEVVDVVHIAINDGASLNTIHLSHSGNFGVSVTFDSLHKKMKVLVLSLRASAALSVTAPSYSAHTLIGRASEAAEKFNAAFPELSFDPATDAVMRQKHGFGIRIRLVLFLFTMGSHETNVPAAVVMFRIVAHHVPKAMETIVVKRSDEGFELHTERVPFDSIQSIKAIA
jgi:hypothetical protein